MSYEKNVVFSLDEDLLTTLINLSISLEKIQDGNHYFFKWAMISAHNAVQTAMCLCLMVVDSKLVRKKETYDKDYGDLDTIQWLYKKLLDPRFAIYIGSKTIDPNDYPIATIERLQKVRNTFIHQQPSHYFFTRIELVELIDFSTKLVKFLVSESERMALGSIKASIEQEISNVERQITNC
ncbi:TPA: hypothetical protein ACMDPE_003509 [Vibrio cholerae]